MYKRIVIKIGTSVIAKDGRLLEKAIEQLVDQVVALRARDIEVVIVTSGAVATGKGLLAAPGAAHDGAQRQVYAAVGQIELMSLYAGLFAKNGYRCAQILVTKEDFRDRAHYANMKNCFENLLRQNIIPVVNENDTISINAFVFTDNDELAGLVGSQLDADAVIFLTSVEGVLRDPAHPSVIPEIREADIASFKRYVQDSKSAAGRGGMRTKFAIAQKLMKHGVTVHILQGTRDGVLVDLIDGKSLGTKFMPAKKISAVKRRLAYSDGLSAGAAYVDRGAERILHSQGARSLLPVGIIKVEGMFKKGDVVEIRSERGKKLGFGIAQYDSSELLDRKGKKGGRAFIHYDYMVVLD